MTTNADYHDNIYRQYAVEEYTPETEPFYMAIGDEIDLFNAAFEQKIPVLLKGPTGCGKTRFVEYMTYHLRRPSVEVVKGGRVNENGDSLPLITVACHEDLTASDLVGRYLLDGESTRWIDDPLTTAVR